MEIVKNAWAAVMLFPRKEDSRKVKKTITGTNSQ
jgi:hypothetical protein